MTKPPPDLATSYPLQIHAHEVALPGDAQLFGAKAPEMNRCFRPAKAMTT